MEALSSRLDTDLKKIGINNELLRLIPGNVQGIQADFKDCFTLYCGENRLKLWVYRGSEVSLVLQNRLLASLSQAKAGGFLLPKALKDGRTYAALNETAWFYVTDWRNLRRVSFSNPFDLMALARMVVDFRSTISCSAIYYLNELERPDNLKDEFKMMQEYLKAFELLAKYRIAPTNFDRLYLKLYPEIITKASLAEELLIVSNYQKLISELTARDLSLRDFRRRNLRIDQEGQALCLRLTGCRLNLPIVDLANLLIKSGRFNNWTWEWFEQLLNFYDDHFRVSKAEIEIVLALLAFPWDFYNLATSYYCNYSHSPVALLYEKLERLNMVEPSRNKLIMSLKKT